jgi:eukaryotic-like serine/threonine-protein kinase
VRCRRRELLGSAQSIVADAPARVPVSDLPRYTTVRELGAGTSGSVYLAQDSETGGQVALKKLVRFDTKSVQRFKREFRSLADLHHPNLVKLFDLQRGEDAWYLSMEYIDGKDLRAHLIDVREVHETRDVKRADDTWVAARSFDSAALAQLLRVFHELAQGVHALHRAGLLHRDLKPGNVLVAKTGRVVVLDFGLVRDLEPTDDRVTRDGTVAGTPAYMAPEQCLGQPLSEASDWYAFGVMLYEVLDGDLPIEERDTSRLIQRKLNSDPAPLSPAQLGIPAELTELCSQLLRRPPEQRPTGPQVLATLAGLRGESLGRLPIQTLELPILPGEGATSVTQERTLIGRHSARLQLMAAVELASAGHSVVASVRGGSGAGKTALIESFLREIERDARHGEPRALVLRSRCYEREAMTFKALDGAMDKLAHFLSVRGDVEAAHLLPDGLAELTQLFPTFQRVRAVQRLLLHERPHPDGAQTRRRAEKSLRALIARIAGLKPVVLWIDDLQWGDLDSASVLRDWFAEPSAVSLLLILSYRSDERETSACLRALEGLLSAAPSEQHVEIELDALSDEDVQSLCAARLPGDAPREVLSRIVAEAHGNPFLALQLSALAKAKLGRGELELSDISMGELVSRSSALLPEGASGILDALAIAGRPLAQHIALRAAGVERDGLALIHALQGLRLLRSRVADDERQLEIYHDRVREAVQAALGADEKKRVSDRVLRALELSGRADPGWLHELALGAGEDALALRYGLLAAERAHASLAFERATELYQRCLRLSGEPQQQAELWRKLAEVLARSRRGAEAADAYLEAAERAAQEQQLPLLQLAASHLLRTGRFEEGEQLVQRVLRLRGISVPQSEAGLYAAIGWERARLALRGRGFERKAASESSREEARTHVMLGVLAVETQFYAPLRAVLFQTRVLRSGLEQGDGMLVGRALCLTAAVSCLAGSGRAALRAEEQLARADALAAELDDHELRAEVLTARTICNFLLGELDKALLSSEQVNSLYETQRTGGEHGDYYYWFAVQTARIGALQLRGRHTQASLELRELLSRAEATANRTALLQATLVRANYEQVQDRAAESRPRLDRERQQLPSYGIGVLHLLHLAAVLRAGCVTYDFDWALGVLDELWEPCMRSPLRHGRMLRFILHSMRARLLLNRHVALGRKGDPLSLLRGDIAELRGMERAAARAVAVSFDARIAYLRGDLETAERALRASLQTFHEERALDEHARALQALGCLLGGEEGRRMQQAGHAASLQLGVVNPRALLRGSFPEIMIDAGY